MRELSSATDTNGRAYARVADIKVGDIVIPDGGFVATINGQEGKCMSEGVELTVQDDTAHGLYVPCAHGKHFLDGQIELTDVGEVYIGLYPKEQNDDKTEA